MINKLALLREQKAKLGKTLIELESNLSKAVDACLKEFNNQELEGAEGKTIRISVVNTPLPTVKNWPKLYKYITKTGEFDLLHKRISRDAWNQRNNEKKKVPGIDVFMKQGLSYHKIPLSKRI